MDSGITAFLFAAGTVVLAEMGDKTQLLAMAFATKYKAHKVLIGVFIATVLNHALAVLVGNLIAHMESAQIWIQAISSLAFILFGLWTIRGDKLEGEDQKKTKFGPIVTVGLAFFLAEMGDKTQLATVALATRFPADPVALLIGTTTGMMIADGIGILVGVVLCRRIPERTIKLVSAAVFVVFGFIGCYEVAAGKLKMDAAGITVTMLILAILTGIAAYLLIKKNLEDGDGKTPAVCEAKIEKTNLE